MIYWGAEYLATFVETLLCFVFCGAFIDKMAVKSRRGLILTLSLIESGMIVLLNNFALFSEITSFLSIALLFVIQSILYKHPIKTLIFTVTYSAILVAADFSIVYLIAYVAKLSTGEILLEHSPTRLVALILSKTMVSFIVYSVYKLKTNKEFMSKKILFGFLTFAVSMLLLLLYIVFKDIRSNAKNLSDISVLFFIVSLILILMLFFGIIKIAELYETKQKTSLLLLRNQMLETGMAETEQTFMLWKSSLHDHKHKIIHFLSLLNKNEIAEIKSEFENEIELLSEQLFYYKTGNDTVDTILSIKQTIANQNKIPFLISGEVPPNCPVSDSHLSVILGNLIDNAINASKNETDPYIEVGTRQMKNYIVIKVSNRFTAPSAAAESPPKNKKFHGIGLKSVEHIVKGYKGEFITEIENEMFIAQIMISM